MSLVVFIFLFTLQGSWPFVKSEYFSMQLFSINWYPSEKSFGFLSLIAGTFSILALSLLVSIPLAFFAALGLLQFTSKKLISPILILIETLAGLPSIVVGLYCLLTVIPKTNQIFSSGTSLLVGAIALSIILIPQLTLSLYHSLIIQHQLLWPQAWCNNLSAESYIYKILIPSSINKIKECCIMGISRGLGETLAILMVSGNVVRMPENIFSSVRTLNANIALEMPYAVGIHRSSLFFSGTITFLFTLFLLFLAKYEKNSKI